MHYVITIHQCYIDRQTNRRTDVMLVYRIYATCYIENVALKTFYCQPRTELNCTEPTDVILNTFRTGSEPVHFTAMRMDITFYSNWLEYFMKMLTQTADGELQSVPCCVWRKIDKTADRVGPYNGRSL